MNTPSKLVVKNQVSLFATKGKGENGTSKVKKSI